MGLILKCDNCNKELLIEYLPGKLILKDNGQPFYGHTTKKDIKFYACSIKCIDEIEHREDKLNQAMLAPENYGESTKSIKKILIDALSEYWEENTELRFGQLIHNMFLDNENFFYMNDKEFLARIVVRLNRNKCYSKNGD